jgi:hypothetical protein
MSDGRLFTDYRPRCDQIADLMPKQEGGTSSYEFRMNLVTQAEDVMRRNMMWAYDAAACGPCDHSKPGTMLPEAYKQTCNGSACTFTPDTKGGLGLGRDYGTTKDVAAAQEAMLRKSAVEQDRLVREPNGCVVASDKLGWAPLV